MAYPKELNFFCGPGGSWDRGRPWYESRFGAAPVRGETSPEYTAFPFVKGVPERMHRLIPDAKLVYMVRDPVERMVSEALHYWSRDYDRRPLAEVLSDPAFADSIFVARSRYYRQLERYLELFDRSQILIVAQEELLEQRNATLARIFRFIGVDDRFVSPGFAAMSNTARDQRLLRRARRTTRRIGLAQRILEGPRARSLLSWPIRPAELEPAQRAALAEHVRDDAERLRRHTGASFDSWSV